MKNLQAVAIVFAQNTDTLTIGTVSFKAVLQVEIGQDLFSQDPKQFIKNSEVIDYIDVQENGIPICDCRGHQSLFFKSYREKGIDLMAEFDKLAMKWVEDNSIHSLSQSLFITLAQSIPHYPISFRPEVKDPDGLLEDIGLFTKVNNSGIQSQEAEKMQMDLELKYNPDNTKARDSIVITDDLKPFEHESDRSDSYIPAKPPRKNNLGEEIN